MSTKIPQATRYMAIYGSKNVLGVQESGYVDRDKLEKILDDLFPASSYPDPSGQTSLLPKDAGERFAIRVSEEFIVIVPITT